MSEPPRRPSPLSRAPSAWLTWAARLVLLFMTPLIFIGGGVTSRDAGMAYETAPLSDGSLINPPGWTQQTQTLWEHGHRLVGWCVGILAIAAVWAALATEKSRPIRLLSIFVLFAVVVQGSLGIYRVNHNSTMLALVHGVWGQICFTSAALFLLVTSPTWGRTLSAATISSPRKIGPLRNSLAILVAGLAVQVILGSITRHAGSRVAVFFHVWLAVILTVVSYRGTSMTLGGSEGKGWMRRLAIWQAAAMTGQLLLGFLAFAVTGGSSAKVMRPTFVEWIIPTLHVVLGAICLALAVCWFAMVLRLTRSSLTQEHPSTTPLTDPPTTAVA